MRPDWEPDELELAAEFAGTGCPRPALLVGAQNGSLPEHIAPGVAGHLAGCRLCQALVQDLAMLQAAAPDSGARARVLSRIRQRERRSRWRWTLAVAVPALAALVLVTVPWRPASRPDPRVIATQPPAPAAPTRADIPKPPVMLPAAALTFRGGPGGAEQTALADFGSAIAPYREGRYRDAVEQLLRFTQKYPSMPEGFFYLGISCLYEGRQEEARSNLERARRLAQPPFRDQVERYLPLSRP